MARRPEEDDIIREARQYVRAHFPDAIGSDEAFGYPTGHAAATEWLDDFVLTRLGSFGDYEDAISAGHDVLFHLMTTKPYISGSSYVRRMSDFGSGPWCAVWDALYWRFVDRHASFFAANPRTAVMVRAKDGLGGRLEEHLRMADAFLARLHG